MLIDEPAVASGERDDERRHRIVVPAGDDPVSSVAVGSTVATSRGEWPSSRLAAWSPLVGPAIARRLIENARPRATMAATVATISQIVGAPAITTAASSAPTASTIATRSGRRRRLLAAVFLGFERLMWPPQVRG